MPNREVGLQTLPGMFVLNRPKVAKKDAGCIVRDFLHRPAVEIEGEDIWMKRVHACGGDVLPEEELEPDKDAEPESDLQGATPND